MQHIRPRALVIALGAIVVLSTHCAAPLRPLRIGLVVWPPYEMLALARSIGRLDSAHVELVDYGSPAEALRAYRNGVIDGVALPTTYVVELMSVSADDRVVLVLDVSTGGDAVVAGSGITRVEDLQGRRVAVESGSLGSLVLSRALARGGLGMSDIRVVPLDVNLQQAAFDAGAVDAVVTYEPYRSKLLARGGRDLFNSTQMPNEIVDVLVVRSAAIGRRERALRHLTDAWFHGVAYLRAHPLDAAQRVAGREHVSPESFLLSLHGVSIADREDNRRWLGGREALLEPHLRSLADVMRSLGVIATGVNGGAVSTDRFIQ